MMWYIFSFLWGTIHSVGRGWVDIFNKSLISGTLTLFWTDLLRSSGTRRRSGAVQWTSQMFNQSQQSVVNTPFHTAPWQPAPYTLRESYREVIGGDPSCWTTVDAIGQLQINICTINNWVFRTSWHHFIAKVQETEGHLAHDRNGSKMDLVCWLCVQPCLITYTHMVNHYISIIRYSDCAPEEKRRSKIQQ